MNRTNARTADPRPARTRAAIFAAAREMGAGDHEVTVHALAKRAGVSRAAFYSHFSSLDDVVCELIREPVMRIREDPEQFGRGDLTPHERACRAVYDLADIVAQHHRFILGVLGWKLSHRAYATVTDEIAQLFQYAYDLLGPAVPEHLPRDQTARFHAGGITELLVTWLEERQCVDGEPCRVDADELATSVLRVLPSWYTGIPPGGEIPSRL